MQPDEEDPHERALRTEDPVREERMLRDHRRALAWALVLLVICVASLFAVGRHPPEAAPLTTVPFIGRVDSSVHSWMDDIQNPALTDLSKTLDRVGSGAVTIPLRVVAMLVLLFRRRWRAAIVFGLTWATSEAALSSLKPWFHRGRPPGALVPTGGYSFPSGHAVAASATAVALVLAFMAAGERRRIWEWAAAVFSFLMGLSRVYLAAHWFSDVVVGTLLGSGIAVLMAAAVAEMRDVWLRHERLPVRADEEEAAQGDPAVP